MDTSEQYIKQCKEAQKDLGWQPAEGDFYYDLGGTWSGKTWSSQPGIRTLQLNDAMSLQFDGHYDNAIPLYRQDQLQEMIGFTPVPSYIQQLATFCHDEMYLKPGRYRNWSWEQLWLAFVMKEKYGKVWDGENWGEEK